jgi:hypothetical protein
MSDRMPLHTIDIPTREAVTPAALEAGDLVVRMFRSCGIDPRKAVTNEMCVTMAQMWTCGRYTDSDFRRACANMLIFNPKLAL